MKQRLLAIFLSLTLMLSLVPSAWAVENEESSQETVVEEPETELIEGLQARINALPDAAALAEMDEDALKAVYNEVQTIYDALDALSTEEVEALELTPLETAAAFFTEQVAPLDESAGIVVSENATWNTTTTLTENLIVNSGVTLTYALEEDGSPDYTFTIHHKKINSMSETERGALSAELARACNAVGNYSVSYEYLLTDF